MLRANNVEIIELVLNHQKANTDDDDNDDGDDVDNPREPSCAHDSESYHYSNCSIHTPPVKDKYSHCVTKQAAATLDSIVSCIQSRCHRPL